MQNWVYVLRANRFQKAVGRSGEFFFFFETELTQKALVNPKIFRSLRFFSDKFLLEKMADFIIFFCKKKKKILQMSVGPVEQGCDNLV